MRKRILSIILVLCMVITLMPSVSLTADAASEVWDGSQDTSLTETAKDGTAGTGYYLVDSAEKLAYVAYLSNNGNDFSGKTVLLTDDIILNSGNAGDWESSVPANSWIPIGNWNYNGAKYFKGTFNGQGHTISGVYLKNSLNIQGLFGYIHSSGVVCNVGLDNSYISGKQIIGGFTGMNEGQIKNCWSNATVTTKMWETGDSITFVGGIAGRNGGTITNCYNIGTVGSTSASGIGGITGSNQSTNYAGTIINCYNAGTMISGSVVGGIAGNCGTAYCSIKYSYSLSSAGNLRGNSIGTFTGCGTFAGGTETDYITLAQDSATGYTYTYANNANSDGTTTTTLLSALNAWVNTAARSDIYTWKKVGEYPVFDKLWEPNYTATVTMNKNGSAWTSSTPTITLSDSSTSLTGVVSGTQSNGVYTFNNLADASTFYVWEEGATDTYTGQSVTKASSSATLNYYSLTLSTTMGTSSPIGGGNYLPGKSVPINVTVDPGYAWSKWTSSDTALLDDQTSKSTSIVMPAGLVVLTAESTLDTYTVGYELNSGSVETANATNYQYTTGDITLNNPTRTGYIFMGWTGSNGASPQTNVTIPTGSSGNKSYTANWKADKPSALDASVVTAKAATSLTIDTEDRYEYSVDGTNWYSGTSGSYTFTGLTAGHAYNLVCRKAEVTTVGSASMASDASDALSVSIKNSVTTPTAAISSVTTNKITMNEVTGGEYSKDGGVTWQDSNEFAGLAAATKYTFAVRMKETETTMASATSATVDQYTVPLTPLVGEGYEIDYSAETISITSGYEVSTASDFSTTLTSGAAVVPGTTNYIRKAVNNLTTPATPASDYIGFTTPLRPAIPTAAAINETVSSKNDGKITDVTTAMEWKITDGTYAVVAADQASNGITGLVDDIYYVRVKAVAGSSFASAAQEITISAGHTITVTFDSKSGRAVSQITGKSYGDKITEIVTAPTLSGYNFAGWYKDAACTNVWTFTLDTLADNITLYAKWSAIPTYTVTGTVVDDVSPAAIVNNANVKLMKGTTQFGTTGLTDVNGNFFINNVPSGTYNLVITKGTKTAIIMVSVSGENVAIGNAVLPSGNANSVLVINGSDTPDIVVGGLNTEAITQLATNASVVITMTVEEKDASAAANGTEVSAAITSAGRQVGMILDIILSSSVNGGNTTAVAETSNLIELIVPIPAELRNKATYVVYRYHGAGIDAITETENADHEKIIIDRTNWTITLYVKKFSTYAIAYTTPTGGSSGSHKNSSVVTPTITVEPSEGGKIAISTDKKTATITPDDGYVIADVMVDGKSVGATGKYTFTDSKNHIITAAFVKKSALPYYKQDNQKIYIGFSAIAGNFYKYVAPAGVSVEFRENPKNFTDNTIAWAKPSIDFVTERELFLGTSSDMFSPNESMTRAMFVTAIGRLYERSYGSVSGTSTFSDVNADDYYAKYVAWANEKGLIKGMGENLFEPNEKVTREQMAVMMLNFATYLKKAEAAGSSLAYADSTSISSWATDGAKYCQETKVITGREGGSFIPQGNATRAEVAAVITRFIQTIVK